MKTWIASACLALALTVGAAVAPAGANDGRWGGSNWSDGWGWNNGWGWNKGWTPPWLGFNNPAWPGQRGGCIDLRFKDGRWVCGKDWHEGRHDKYVSRGFIAQKTYAAGYRHIFDIDRDGSRYKVKALDRHGRRVLLTFNARNGNFIKRKYL